MSSHTTYDEKTFHRKFETSHGYLTADQFPPIDWAEQSQMEMLFPLYRREQIAMEKRGEKLSKMVDIGSFNLKTPDRRDDLFVQASLEIEPHKRCALFGINGSGKTTLFDSISSGEFPDFPKYLHVHHMKELEHVEDAEKLSVIDTVLTAHPFVRILLPMEKHLQSLIDAETDAESERAGKLRSNLEYVQRSLTQVAAHTARDRATKMLTVLGFDAKGLEAPISSLSGGLRMRVALACAFIIDPDLLLLDEPTNHLDMPSVLWLENKLRGYKGSFLLVTHDRTLLENVVTSVMLIQELKLEYFNCGFKEFEKRKEKNDKDKEVTIDKFLTKNRNLAPTQPLYKLKMKYQAWQQARVQRQVQLASKFTFKSPPPLPCTGDLTSTDDVSLIKVDNVRFSYNPESLPFIFDDPISIDITQGVRLGIMGPNGAGKSTFLKLITGKIKPVDGSITSHPDYHLAYFGQHSTKELKMDMTPLEFMVASFPEEKEAILKQHLEKTSIGYGPMNTRMQDLSFSQRSCVIFAKLTFVPPHLLILDGKFTTTTKPHTQDTPLIHLILCDRTYKLP